MKAYEEIRPAKSMTPAQEKLINLNYVFTPYFENDGGDLIKVGELWTPLIIQGRCDEPVQIRIHGREIEFSNMDSPLFKTSVDVEVLSAIIERANEIEEAYREKYGDDL